MFDYAAWAGRASAFLRRLTRLPGAIEVADEIESPATDDHSLEWLESERCGLPPEIRHFLRNASRRCCFRYQWTPPGPLCDSLGEILPDHSVLRGGGDLCELAKYQVYSHRDWFRDPRNSLPFGSLLLGDKQLFGTMAGDEASGLLPLMELKGGDRIALGAQPAGDFRPVVYVDKFGPSAARSLAPTFERFLSDWEAISYVEPHADTLAPWLDPITGRLKPDPAKARSLRKHLTGRDEAP